MTDDDDPFAGGIELEFDAMEARRERANVVPKMADLPPQPADAVGTDPAGGAPYPSSPPARVDAEMPAPNTTGASVPTPQASRPPGAAFGYKPLEGTGREPPSLWRTLLLGLGLVVVSAGILMFWYRHEWFPPKPADIVAKLSEGPGGEVIYDGQTFTARFEREFEIEGTVNQIASSFWPEVPFMTHEVVLVTGDYANPDLVTVSELKDHAVVAHGQSGNAEGKLWLVQVIPADAAVLAQLLRVQKGQYVVLIGDVVEGNLTNADGQMTIQTIGISRVMRLREVLWEDGPPAAPPTP